MRIPTPGMPRMCRAWRRLAVASLLVANACASAAVLDRFIDPADGMFDISASASERKSILPVPIVISEPAVG